MKLSGKAGSNGEDDPGRRPALEEPFSAAPGSVEDRELRSMGAKMFFLGYVGVGCAVTELIIRWMLPASWWQVSASVPTYGWMIILGISLLVVVSCLAVLASKRWGRKLLFVITTAGMFASSVLGVGLMLVLAFAVLFQLLPELRARIHRARLRVWTRRHKNRPIPYYGDLSVSVLWACAVLLAAWIGVVVLGCKNVLP